MPLHSSLYPQASCSIVFFASVTIHLGQSCPHHHALHFSLCTTAPTRHRRSRPPLSRASFTYTPPSLPLSHRYAHLLRSTLCYYTRVSVSGSCCLLLMYKRFRDSSLISIGPHLVLETLRL